MSDKTGWEGRGQQFRDSHWHSRDPVPSPGPGQRKYLCAGVPKGGYSVGLLGAKTEIPDNRHWAEAKQRDKQLVLCVLPALQRKSPGNGALR